jgi:dTDP-4-amino-4,6-dideoxygalactose transaminase
MKISISEPVISGHEIEFIKKTIKKNFVSSYGSTITDFDTNGTMVQAHVKAIAQ